VGLTQPQFRELQRRSATVVEAVRAGWLRMPDGKAYELADAYRGIEAATRKASCA